MMVTIFDRLKWLKNHKLSRGCFWFIAVDVKSFLKLLPMIGSINWPSFVTEWCRIQKIHSKIHSALSANTHKTSNTHMTSKSTSKLIEWFKISKKTEYVKEGTWLFHDVGLRRLNFQILSFLVVVNSKLRLVKMMEWFKI